MTSPNDDSEHLQLLAISHYIVAGLVALFALLPVIHLVVGVAMVTGRLGAAANKDPDAHIVGWFFVFFATACIVCGLVFAACLAFAGRFLKQRRHYLYCLVLAGFACMFMPFGTVLGVFTIVVLMRPSVKVSFGAAAPTSEAPSP
jgi:magnesium-transporting ATPase (P-type)